MTSKWETVRLGDVAFKRTDFTPVEPSTEYEVVGVQRSGWGLTRRGPVRGDSMKFSKLMKLDENDLVYRVITAFEAPSAVVSAGFARTFVTPQTFPVFRLDRARILPGYMSLLTTYTGFHNAMAERCTGSVLRRKTLSVGSFLDIPLTLPPLPEQRRIVDLIGALDDAIEAAEERVSAAQTAELQVLNDLVGQPESAQSRTIGELFDVIDCEHKTAPESQTDIFAYSVGTGAIRNGAFRLDRAKPVAKDTYEEWTQRAAPSSGDVVLTREAPVGEVALVTADLGPICLGQRTVLLRQKADLPGPVLWAALRTSHYQSLFTQNSIGLTVSRINIKAIKMIKLPELDPERIDTIGAISAQFLHEIESAQEVASSLRALRTELLTALLSGAHEIPESYDSVMELAGA